MRMDKIIEMKIKIRILFLLICFCFIMTFTSNLIDFDMIYVYFQSEEGTSQLRIKIISGQSLAKKDIFGAR